MSSNYIREENQLQFNTELINSDDDKNILFCYICENNSEIPFIGYIQSCTEYGLTCAMWDGNIKILKPSNIFCPSHFTLLSKQFPSKVIECYEYGQLVRTDTNYKFNCNDEIRENNLHNKDIIKITYKYHKYTLEYTTKINFICDDYMDIDVPYNNREAWLEDWFGVVTKYISGAYDEFYAYHIYPEDVIKRDVTIEVIDDDISSEIKPVTNVRFDFPTAVKYLIAGQPIRHVTWSKDKYLFFDALHQVVFNEDSKFVNIMKYANLDNWEIRE